MEQPVAQESEQDALGVFALSEAMLPSRALHVVAELGVADLFGGAPRAAAELAETAGADPVALRIVLRLLAGHGLFHEPTTGVFELTGRGELLRSDHPRSLRAFVRTQGAVFDAVGALEHSVRTGEVAFEHVRRRSYFEHLRENPDQDALFNAAMSDLSRFDQDSIVTGYDFSRYSRIVDVAGGDGTLLKAILAGHPGPVGVLFDQEHVTATVAPTDRMTVVAGDFFGDIVAGGDLYLMKNIIHDWADDDAVAILRACRKVVPDHGRLVLFERMMAANEGPTQNNRLSLLMYVTFGSRERTRVEFEELFAASGFALDRTVAVGPVTHAVEAVPV
ncbi:methyltransferase [Actinophytocola oryzae]|uniref:O-methyltransferase n=1 Tax=Actinophytocola oryzae TaxID=502181 RepID=A0A4R7UV90_9PSEU|nr:methyltransferase [Actinophytocola oryzae]TDV38590.1 O-methyltransferase [Actinophytocola oryzae]